MIRKSRWLTALVLVGAAAFAAPAEAASTLVFKVTAVERPKVGKGPYGRVYCGFDGVMTLGGDGWKSVADAHEVARRLNALAEEGTRPRDITVRRARRSYLIVTPDRRIVEVNKRMASIHGSTPQRLARQWAENLKRQFGKPYLSMSSLVVPLGERRTGRVRGSVRGPLNAAVDSAVASAVWEAPSQSVSVTGLAVGEAKIRVADGENVLLVPVRVAKYAARLADSLTAEVTGALAPPEMVGKAARAAVATSLMLEPGAWANLRPEAAVSLEPNRSSTVAVCVSAAGEGYLSCRLRSTVAVRNTPLALAPVDMLMVSNKPERLRSHGLWFEGSLVGSQAARLLYHHVNAMKGPADLVVEVWNLGDRAARVHVLEGTAGPSRDEAWVGHRAAAQFLVTRKTNVGWVVAVPPGAAVPVLSQRTTPGSTSSGVLELRPLEEGDLRVRVYLAPRLSRILPRPIGNYLQAPLAGQWHYPQPQRYIRERFVVGNAWTFITIGAEAAVGVAEGDRLAGSYGVIHEIDLELVNPTAEPVRVAIMIAAAGGPARSALLVDGRLTEVAALKTHAEAEVARYSLEPGQVRRVHIETMPQAGSNYPVRLLARPV